MGNRRIVHADITEKNRRLQGFEEQPAGGPDVLVSEGTSEGSKNKDNCILTGQSQPWLVISNVQANSSIVIMDLRFSTVKLF